MEPISFAISTVDYAIQIVSHIKHTIESYQHNPFEYNLLLSRFRSIRDTLCYLTQSTSIDLSSPIWGSAFDRITTHFQASATELKDIHHLLRSRPFWKLLHANEISRRIKLLEDGVDELQRHLDLLGFFTASNHQSASQSHATLATIHDLQQSIAAMEDKLQLISTKLNANSNSPKQPYMSSNHPSSRQRTTNPATEDRSRGLRTDSRPKNDLYKEYIPFNRQGGLLSRIQNIENAIHRCTEKALTSNLPKAELDTINSSLDNLRKKCRLNPSDITITSRIDLGKRGASRAFRGTVTLRGSDGFVSRVGLVAVKVIANQVKARDLQHIVLRHAFLLREMDHPCILKFYGAYWSHSGYEPLVEGELNWNSDSAFIVTEYMPHNLRTALGQGFLSEFRTKVLVLRDVASGVEYLHSRGVVHFKLKPENIFLRCIHGQIAGKAKIGDIGFNSTTLKDCQELLSSSREAFPAHMPPEGYVGNESYAPLWDIWSFGALICILFTDEQVETRGSVSDLGGFSYGTQNNDIDDGRYVRLRPGSIRDLQLRALAQKCLSTRSDVRPSATFVRRALERMIWNSPDALSKSDHGDLMQSVGKEHLAGHNGREKDAQQAFNHFKTAVGHGNVPSLVNLGDCYFYGHGVGKDISRGMDLYHVAAQAGYPSGQFRLGECYYRGDGVGKDIRRALELYTRAGEQGNAPAKYQLGCHYFNNRDGKPNYIEIAIDHWKQASSAGHHFAQFRLAKCLETGEGVPMDLALAKMWYRKAASKGHFGASLALHMLSEPKRRDLFGRAA